MKKISLLIILTGLMIVNIGCGKEEEIFVEAEPIVEMKDTAIATSIKDTTTITKDTINEVKVIVSGEFQNGDHPTSGSIKVIKESSGDLKLQFTNFTTDSGPNLFIYLSEDLKAQRFINTNKRPVNGTYTIDLDDNIDLKKFKHVLIWCKTFSVLFGSAELK